jgi:hypothetical protein
MLARSSEAIAVNPECRAVHNVRFWHKTDMAIALNDVRFWGQSGHRSDVTKCPLLTQSGHERFSISAVQPDP